MVNVLKQINTKIGNIFIRNKNCYFTEKILNKKFKDEKEFQVYLRQLLKKQGFQLDLEVKNSLGRPDILASKGNYQIIIEVKDIRDAKAIKKLQKTEKQLIRYNKAIPNTEVALAFLVKDGYENDEFLDLLCHYLNLKGIIIIYYHRYERKVKFRRFKFDILD